ncbi:HalOD1 output domain-containing protein [Halobaculum sp. EA56]|uniref:HalOD1 output domain-containing protein n=1 Tax=Halobaculum sp. EA56 TaxID=3421648 RepID=UPI003EB814B8
MADRNTTGDASFRTDGPHDGAAEPDADGVVRTRMGDRSPSVAVIEAAAAARGTDPLDLAPLHATLDPDALERLLGRGEGGDGRAPRTHATFEFAGCLVCVAGDGTVRAEPVGDAASR